VKVEPFEEVAADDLTAGEEVDLVDEAEDASADAEEELPFLDIDQFKDQYVKIRVDGEEVTVPLSEAVAGYQRQADYTRKTQSLAQQKNELQWASAIKGALENDPQATIELLATQFGVRLPASQPKQDDDPFAGLWADDPEPVDPKYAQIEARLRAFEEERAQQRLEQTIAQLSQKYGDEFDAREVVAAALASGSNDLEATFKQIKFDKVMEDAKAAKAAAASKAAKVAAKKDAAVVSGGSSKGGRVSDSGDVLSIADAWRQAKQSLGG
jgi:predicted metal-dependent hydrolase